jgi:excisionase family DNA binding protein
MNKDDAATFLGISVRTLQRLTSEGVFQTTTQGKKGVATYDEDDLRAWREMSEEDRRKAREEAAERRSSTSLSPMTVTPGDSVTSTSLVATDTHDTTDTRREFARMIGEAVASGSAVANISHKLVLTLKEASQLAGLSRDHLRGAIESKKLKGRIIGRGFKVKREDLEQYVRKL